MPIMPGAEPFSFETGTPAGIGVLLCHGFTGSPQSLRDWGRTLAEAGHSVECPRLPGHGTTMSDMNNTRWPDWYAAVERALVELSARCDQVFVGGLSMGGTLALRLAQHHGEQISGLLLVNPALATERKDAAALKILAKILPTWAGIANDIKKPDSRELAYPRLPLKAALSLQELWADVRSHLDRVHVPIITFRSRVDHVVEPLSGRLLVDGVSSADVTERILEDSFHVATLDNDAPQIFAESLAWIAERRTVRA